VNLVVGTGLGTKSNEAIYLTDQAVSPFDTAGVQIARSALAESAPCPCVTPPCGSVTCDIISPTQYLSCPPDFNFDLLSQGQLTSDATNRALTSGALANSLTIVAKNGVTTNTEGIAVSSTGTGILNQRLFSIKMGQFLPDALYTVTLQVSGDFQMTAGLNPRVYSDLYFGVGNGKNWIGVQKADPQGSVLTGSIVQGTYDDILSIAGTGVELSKWPTPGISTPQSATMTLIVGKDAKDNIGATIIFKHGDVTTSATAVPNFNLSDCAGAPLPSGVSSSDGTCYLEAVAFRKSRDTIVKIKNIQLKFEGTAPVCGIDAGSVSFDPFA